jgi:molybdopterin-binding protein
LPLGQNLRGNREAQRSLKEKIVEVKKGATTAHVRIRVDHRRGAIRGRSNRLCYATVKASSVMVAGD